MTRHERLMAEGMAARDCVAAIRSLKFFPADWLITVQLTNRPARYLFRRPRRAPRVKRGTARLPHLRLLLGHNWLENVFEPGLAVAGDCFTLSATPCILPEGAQGAWQASLMNRAPYALRRVIVRYAGLWVGATPEDAMRKALTHYQAAMCGDDRDF